MTKSFAELTPYQFASNTPIEAIDLDGLESTSNKYNYSVSLGRPYAAPALFNGDRWKNAQPSEHVPDGVAVGVVGSGTVKNANVSIEKSKIMLFGGTNPGFFNATSVTKPIGFNYKNKGSFDFGFTFSLIYFANPATASEQTLAGDAYVSSISTPIPRGLVGTIGADRGVENLDNNKTTAMIYKIGVMKSSDKSPSPGVSGAISTTVIESSDTKSEPAPTGLVGYKPPYGTGSSGGVKKNDTKSTTKDTNSQYKSVTKQEFFPPLWVF